MDTSSLTDLTQEHLELARSASSGRSAARLYGGPEHTLSQTVVALARDRALDEHENPGEATIQVLHGRVQLLSGDQAAEAAAGGLIVVPDASHSLRALEDSVILLTVAKHG